MNGGAGNDTLVWNQGDGSDRANGTPATTAPRSAARRRSATCSRSIRSRAASSWRTNLGPFTFDAATERFEVNGLGGTIRSQLTTAWRATLLSVDGGAGVDTVKGSDGADLILGGEGNDVLGGGGGDDRIVGDRGTDTMNGGTGDDTLVWNNGDGTDVANGDGGRDDVEVNGAAAAGDIFTVQPNGAHQVRPPQPGAVLDRHRLQRDAAR